MSLDTEAIVTDQLQRLDRAQRAEMSRSHPLELRSFAEVVAGLETAGPRTWDVEGLVVHGQHGVLGSVPKAGKGWDAIDLAVSMSSGTPWLGHFACPNPGPVVIYPGEEDEHELRRRVEAVATARALDPGPLPIHLAERTPRLSRPEELDIVRRGLELVQPRMAILDPLYHAAAGADHRSLFQMGELLAEASDLARAAGASLLAVTHFNRSDRKGAERLTGAGAAEWGRFLIAAEVTLRRQTREGGTEVVRRVEVTGTSISDMGFTVARRIYALDPTDLNSPLVYDVSVGEGIATTEPGLTFPQRRVLAALGGQDEPRTIQQIGDALAADGQGNPYKRNTISGVLNALSELGRADAESASGPAKRWWRTS